jgi:hypothetical protein
MPGGRGGVELTERISCEKELIGQTGAAGSISGVAGNREEKMGVPRTAAVGSDEEVGPGRMEMRLPQRARAR